MNPAVHHPGENVSNDLRKHLAKVEPKSLRTFTPSQAILARSSGIFHWTPENRRLYDFTSGVLVANLGHNPVRWTKRFFELMEWDKAGQAASGNEFFEAITMTAYNAITSVEIKATEMLVDVMFNGRFGGNSKGNLGCHGTRSQPRYDPCDAFWVSWQKRPC
jgi:hypothetical protein